MTRLKSCVSAHYGQLLPGKGENDPENQILALLFQLLTVKKSR